MMRAGLLPKATVVVVLGALALFTAPGSADARRYDCWFCVDSCPTDPSSICAAHQCGASGGTCLAPDPFACSQNPLNPGCSCSWALYVQCDAAS